MKTLCVVCGLEMNVKPSRLKRVKFGITCSKLCFGKRQEKLMRGDGNHQFGKLGKANKSFKTGTRLSNYGYIMHYLPKHPMSNGDGYYKEHRSVVENNRDLFDASYFTCIEGVYYLKRSTVVHHINEIKTDNRIENLLPLTRGEHTTLHNKTKTIIRDGHGRIIGVLKLGELSGKS